MAGGVHQDVEGVAARGCRAPEACELGLVGAAALGVLDGPELGGHLVDGGARELDRGRLDVVGVVVESCRR